MITKNRRKPRAPWAATGQRRRQILDAALNCFLRHGFDGTTMDLIRSQSGASHGSIYHHFGSKEAIALALYVEGMRDYQAGVAAALRDAATARQGIQALVGFHLRWTAADRNRSLYLTRAGTADVTGDTAAAITQINQDFFSLLGDWMRPFVAAGEVLALPGELYASLVLGATSHLCRHWLAGRIELDLTAMAEPLAEAAWRSLRAGGAPSETKSNGNGRSSQGRSGQGRNARRSAAPAVGKRLKKA
jgi:AcrR family transcriptional regulator